MSEKTMPKVITFTLTVPLPEKVEGYGSPQMAAHATLRDALAEFKSHRYPISDYLDRRYPDEEYSWIERGPKTTQLQQRIDLSQVMCQSIKSISGDAPAYEGDINIGDPDTDQVLLRKDDDGSISVVLQGTEYEDIDHRKAKMVLNNIIVQAAHALSRLD